MRTALPELIATHKKPLHDLKANDDTAKLLQKKYADSDRHTAEHNLQVGDTVLVRQQKQNKLSTPCNPTPFIVEKVKGNMFTATNSQYTVTRNSSLFKAVPLQDVHQEPDKPELAPDSEDDDSSRDPLQTHHQRSAPIQSEQVQLPPDEDLSSSPLTREHTRITHPTHPNLITRSGRVVKKPSRFTS